MGLEWVQNGFLDQYDHKQVGVVNYCLKMADCIHYYNLTYMQFNFNNNNYYSVTIMLYCM